MRWPLYPAEVIASACAIVLIGMFIKNRVCNWQEVTIIIPWLGIKFAFGLWLCYQAFRAGGDIPLQGINVFLSNALLFVGPLSVSLMLLMILKKERAK